MASPATTGPALSSTSIPRASDNHPRIHLTFISMLLFIPAARLIVVVTQGPVVSVYNNGASLVPKQVASRRGVNGENQRRPPFGLKAMVAKKVCRVIGWALKYRLYLGERCPAFSSGIEGLSVAYRVASQLPPGRRLSNSFDAKSLARVRGFDARQKNIVCTSGWIARDGVSGKSRNGL